MISFDELCAKHRRLLTPKSCIETGPGWINLIDRYFNVVDKELPPDADYVVQQVKEKRGSLRIYDVHPPSGAIDRARELAEARSYYTCDRCGQPGVLRDLDGWLSVRCEEHASETGEYAPPRDPSPSVHIGSPEPRTWRRYDPTTDAFVAAEEPTWNK